MLAAAAAPWEPPRTDLGAIPGDSPIRPSPLVVRLWISLAAGVLVAGVVLAITASDPAPQQSADVTAIGEGNGDESRVIAGTLPVEEPSRIDPLGTRPAPPSRISIPDAGVDGEIVPVGQAPEGIVIPQPDLAGWYRFGPRPGESGRAIIVGHINSVEGPALFSTLGSAPTGAEVVVTDQAGKHHVYRVTGQLQVAKDDFPADRIYGPTGKAELVMITCGGDYDEETGFEDNVIVFASAVS